MTILETKIWIQICKSEISDSCDSAYPDCPINGGDQVFNNTITVSYKYK